MSEYIAFQQSGTSISGKTEVWDVVATRTQTSLGRIKWFPRWRQYAFFPTSDTIFNTDCLNKISNHVAHLNRRYKEEA